MQTAVPRGKYSSFISSNLSIVSVAGMEAMCLCPFHEDHNASFQINIETGLFICFAGSCGAHGSIRTLERHLGLRAQEDQIDVRDLRARIDALRHPEADVMPTLGESYLSRYRFPTPYWGPCPEGCSTPAGRPCKDHRGFLPQTVASFDLGADPMGEYVTIPFRDMNGHLLGVIKRFLDPDAELRYKYPKGFKRIHNLFASWLVEEDDEAHTVVLTEGAIDCMRVWEAGYPAMAIYGSSINPAQVRILRRLGIVKVILFFDNDAAGRKCIETCKGWHENRRGTKIVKKYEPLTDLRRDFLVEAATYGNGVPNDPGAMTVKQIDRCVTNTRRL